MIRSVENLTVLIQDEHHHSILKQHLLKTRLQIQHKTLLKGIK
jgi:hypothetical protein